MYVVVDYHATRNQTHRHCYYCTPQVKSDLLSLLSNKRELCYRVRVEKTGRPPEQPTQTVVQRIVKVAAEEVSRRSVR